MEKKVLFKNIEIAEKLGSATCLCVDKTGVITKNKQ